jgi:hypothetical protein
VTLGVRLVVGVGELLALGALLSQLTELELVRWRILSSHDGKITRRRTPM